MDAEDSEGARRALAGYLAEAILSADFEQHSAAHLTAAEVMILYANDCIKNQKRQREAGDRMDRLVEFFGDMQCVKITPSTTEAYVRWRTHAGRKGKDEWS